MDGGRERVAYRSLMNAHGVGLFGKKAKVYA